MNDYSDILSFTTPRDALTRLGTWMRTLRQQRVFTQTELARRSGVPATTISRLERTGCVSTESLFRILFALEELDGIADFLKERGRLATLSAPPTGVRLRVRHRRQKT